MCELMDELKKQRNILQMIAEAIDLLAKQQQNQSDRIALLERQRNTR